MVIGPWENKDYFPYQPQNKVVKMVNSGSNDVFDVKNQLSDAKNNLQDVKNQLPECVKDTLSADDDLIMEHILENINNTPIGQVLKKIASLPEVRKEKVLNVRQQLTDGHYNLNERLDIALDKVLEDLTM